MMYLRSSVCIALMLLLLPLGATAQDGEEMLEKFNDNLMASFIAPLRASGVEITPELRAKCTAYQLRRLLNDGGAFEHDRKRVAALREAVKEFITAAGGQQAWQIVENGLDGEYNAEIERLLGGTGYVPPVFISYDEAVRERKDREYSDGLLEKYGLQEDITLAAEALLNELKEKDYTGMLEHSGGRFHEEWSGLIQQMNQSPEARQEMDQFANSVKWKLTYAGLSESSPMMAHLLFDLYAMDEWEEYEMYLLLDEGNWRVVAFDEE